MKVQLLYPDHEWMGTGKYHDFENIEHDLGLKTLFLMSSKEVVEEDGVVRKLLDSDDFIRDVMSRVMTVPLANAEEIRFRQDIIRDCLNNEGFITGLYGIVNELNVKWEQLGRKQNENRAASNDLSWMITRIRVIRLFVDTLSKLKIFFYKYKGDFASAGIADFVKGIIKDFDSETEKKYRNLLDNVSFLAPEVKGDPDERTVSLPKLVMECSVGAGLKLEKMQVGQVDTIYQKYRNPNSAINKLRDYVDNHTTPDAVLIQGDIMLEKQTNELVNMVVRYVVSYFEPFHDECTVFFDQLRFQTAFYRGAVTLRHHASRFRLPVCFPTVCAQSDLAYDELKEFVMSIEQRVTAVGNTCELKDRMLIIITGANQGGKSTFLRSCGIAQVMMQCGLFVTAKSFSSGIFPSIFTHFTRREDSSMNSGRLDEELSRMSQIIDYLRPDSLVLLNESFATTTEKEGSEIAYNIVRALHEAGVRIITVTHLLSFARQLYSEAGGDSADPDGIWKGGVSFFCAERLEDGRRTYRMKKSVPELTSFGLDLFNEIIKTDGISGQNG